MDPIAHAHVSSVVFGSRPETPRHYSMFRDVMESVQERRKVHPAARLFMGNLWRLKEREK